MPRTYSPFPYLASAPTTERVLTYHYRCRHQVQPQMSSKVNSYFFYVIALEDPHTEDHNMFYSILLAMNDFEVLHS